jgi:hypothetical protein
MAERKKGTDMATLNGYPRRSNAAEEAETEIDEIEFEDLASFHLKPEQIEGETPAFRMQYAAYLEKRGLRFD